MTDLATKLGNALDDPDPVPIPAKWLDYAFCCSNMFDATTCTVAIGGSNTTLVRRLHELRPPDGPARANGQSNASGYRTRERCTCAVVWCPAQPQVTPNLIDQTGKLMRGELDFDDAGAYASSFLSQATAGASPLCLTFQMNSISKASSVVEITSRALNKRVKPTALLVDPGLLDIVRYKSLRNTEGLEVRTSPPCDFVSVQHTHERAHTQMFVHSCIVHRQSPIRSHVCTYSSSHAE